MNKREPGDASPSKRHRVVALINPVLHCRATCAELLNSGAELVGIVEAQTKSRGLPLSTFRRLIRKQGWLPTASQVAARLTYLAVNRRRDRQVYRRLFDAQKTNRTLHEWGGPVVRCETYSDPHVRNVLREWEPDVLVVHTQTWVGKDVRDIPSTGLVIGGHPGITPFYRGSHSSFWALLNQQPERIGWTAFHVDRGVDTGDVIVQGRLSVQPDDSYMTLNWRGMIEIAKAQAATIQELDRTGIVPRHAHAEIPPHSEFGLPRLGEYLRYRRCQQAVR
jgi:folate-dependent phosphoribosylglycinamide formyltransferase PurN